MSFRKRLYAVEGRIGIMELPPFQTYTYREGETGDEALVRHGLPKLWWNGVEIFYVGVPELKDRL